MHISSTVGAFAAIDLPGLAALNLAGCLRFTRVGCGVFCWMTAISKGWLWCTLLDDCDLQGLAALDLAGCLRFTMAGCGVSAG